MPASKVGIVNAEEIYNDIPTRRVLAISAGALSNIERDIVCHPAASTDLRLDDLVLAVHRQDTIRAVRTVAHQIPEAAFLYRALM